MILNSQGPDYFAQFGEDKWLYESGLLPANGTYVDVGCSDPFLGNNCQMLRQMGWTGLSIDGLDYSQKYWDIGAKFVQTVVSTEPVVRFLAACNPALARVCQDGREVQARTLDSLLIEHGIGQVDLLSLDLEGHEWSALMSGQWMVPPKIIVSEYLTASIDGGPDVRDDRVEEYLLSHGYDKAWSSCSNNIFVRK